MKHASLRLPRRPARMLAWGLALALVPGASIVLAAAMLLRQHREARATRCFECGKYTVEPRRGRSRRVQMHGQPHVIPDNVEIPTCAACGAEWYDETTADRVTEASIPA